MSEADEKRLAEDAEKLTAPQLAEKYACGLSTVYRIFRQHGIGHRHRGGERKPIDVEKALALRAKGLDATKIAKKLGVWVQSVQRVFQKVDGQEHQRKRKKTRLPIGEIQNDRYKGLTTLELAEKYKASQSGIKALLRRENCYIDYGCPDAEDVWRLRAEGLTRIKIAEQLGCSLSTVDRRLREKKKKEK